VAPRDGRSCALTRRRPLCWRQRIGEIVPAGNKAMEPQSTQNTQMVTCTAPCVRHGNCAHSFSHQNNVHLSNPVMAGLDPAISTRTQFANDALPLVHSRPHLRVPCALPFHSPCDPTDSVHSSRPDKIRPLPRSGKRAFRPEPAPLRLLGLIGKRGRQNQPSCVELWLGPPDRKSGALPAYTIRGSPSRRSRSSALSVTIYLFTAGCFAITTHLRATGVYGFRDWSQNQRRMALV
jgi:hypothetical protein